ncbi:hypothetical protein FEM48_Zijuj09G0217400 [Ziziphus jujuba var. spinosa]|uniref:Uncharacterized protein n=1 Tax=Ziziphus jujuba var. spinosa TaxID=714518 RepID=A0A978UVH4_ZIZJJ|nr:hypothetical protein FEM48_Zijuj09G0217400 [Ziziphus jujuba var. spinosa]
MNNMVRTCSRIERVVVVGAMTHLTSSNLSSMAVLWRGGPRQRSGDDVVNPLKVSLEDLYFGTSNKLSLSWNVICSKCNGVSKTLQTSKEIPGLWLVYGFGLH